MPNFRYVALDQGGREVDGVLEAADKRAAVSGLRAESLLVVEIGPDSGGTPSRPSSAPRQGLILGLWNRVRPVWTRDTILFFEQLALMLRAGLTLLQTLQVAEEQCPSARLSRAIGELAEAVRAGSSFSQALRSKPRYFKDIIVSMVESAEASGELDAILDEVAQYLERRLELRNNLLTSMTYPAIVILVALAVFFFMVLKVVPKFEHFFQSRGRSLPPSTQFLMDLSRFLRADGVYLLIAALVLGLVIGILYMTRSGRYALDRMFLSVPVFGGLATIGAMAYFGRTLSMLLRSGVTLMEGLRITSRGVSNAALRMQIAKASDEVLAGQSVSQGFSGPVVPPMVPQVIAVGERTGALDHVLAELGTYYDRRLQLQIRRLTALLEPVMILILGGIVGFVYYALFQAVLGIAR